MATYKHLRSSTANKRPTTSIADGQLAINTNTASPGLFFKDSAGTGIVKVGPVHVGTTAPNATPATGGSTGNYLGEQWLDTSVSPAQMKVWNGSAWIGVVADELPVSKLQDGSARQLLQTDAAGTGVEWTSNVDVPGTLDVTGATTLDSTLTVPAGSAAAPTVRFTGDTNTGIYSPGADQLALSTNGTGRLFVDASGNVGVGGTPFNPLDVFGNVTTGIRYKSAGSYAGIVADNSSSTGGGFFSSLQNGTQKAIFGVTGAFIGDTSADCGVFAETGQHIRFFTDGSVTEKVRITSAGLVGIGTSSPANLLHVSGTSGTPAIFERTSATGSFVGLKDSTSFVYIGNTNGVFSIQTPGSSYSDKLVVTSAGNVGIGTTDARGVLRLAGSSANAFPNNGGLLWLTDTNAATDYKNWSVSSINGDFGVARASDAFNTAQNAYKITGSATQGYVGEHIWYTNNSSEKVRIDNSGRLLVGTSSVTSYYGTTAKSYITDQGGSYIPLALETFRSDSAGAYLVLGHSRSNTAGNYTILQDSDILGLVSFNGSDGTDLQTIGATIKAEVDGTPGANVMPGRIVLSTTAAGASSPTERMRIDNAGSLIYGTSTSPGADIASGTGFYYQISTGLFYVRSNGSPVAAFNRGSNDGTLVEFKQDQITEGTISVSGTTVSYNGAHLSRWSQLPSGAERTEILRGTVLSNIDEMCEWDKEDNEQLNRMKVSDIESDKNVSGVFQAWDDDDDTYTNDFYCAMTGDFIIRIAAGITVQRGDLLMSAGDGTAKPQDDDIIRSKTIAKVTSTNVTCTYEDGSYCVPCVLMAC